MVTPREHIEEIRRSKFAIGGEENPLTEDLIHAVKHLSAELYTRDVQFLMELIQIGVVVNWQNAEDNEYEADVEPSLEFVMTRRDVAGVGAPATLLVFNNEKGFTRRNIDSLCSVGRSTKRGYRQGGYIGENGIGFKSVFLITSQPYVLSNGYNIRFNEIPPAGDKIRYIVPEWIEKPDIEDLRRIYSSQWEAELPNTVILLPLRPEKVEGVKEQLANIHPEVILFMSKITRLCVCEDDQDQNPRVTAVSVSKEIGFLNVKDEGSESFILHLLAQENGKSNGEYGYYMWRQRFAVDIQNQVEERRDVEDWVITLAFPREDRVTTGNRLRRIREDIRAKLRTEEVLLCEPKNAYCIAIEARRILPDFRQILEKAAEQHLEMPIALWSDGMFIIHSCLDESTCLDFLGVDYVGVEWYSTCIQRSPLWIAGLSEDLYVKLLSFIADHWNIGLLSSLQDFPLFKFENGSCFVWWASLRMALSKGNKIYISSEEGDIAWLTRWNKVPGSVQRYNFMPNATQMAMKSLSNSAESRLRDWLDRYAGITYFSVSSFCKQLLEDVKESPCKELIVNVAHFCHFSSVNGYMDSREMLNFCENLPLATELGILVSSNCKAKLVPSFMSKWHKLIGNNPWVARGIVALSPAYMKPNASGLRGERAAELEKFMRDWLGAVDIPKLKPPNTGLPAVSSPIAEDQAVLLLEWILIQSSIGPLPQRFQLSIMEGKWLRTHRGYESPNKSFLYNTEWSLAGVMLKDLPFIDSSFYNLENMNMNDFERALQGIGVMVEFGKGCETVAKIVQMHTDFKVITRLYKYLHHFHWQPRDSDSIKICIPRSDGLVEWKDSKMCVVHDDNGLFCGRLHILEGFYEDALLPFFSSNLGVSLHPSIEDYCNLWMDWIVDNRIVTEWECCLVWRNMLKQWSLLPSGMKGKLGKDGLKIPAHISDGHIHLSAPNETFIPDNLTLTHLFKTCSTKIIFVWYPNPSHPEIPLNLLFSMYESLGGQKISEAVERKELSISNDISLHRLHAGEGLLGKGFYTIILGYLASPPFLFSADKRHQIVRALLESSAYEAVQPFAVVYTLTATSEYNETEHINVTAQSAVRWEKDVKKILIQKYDRHNQKEKMCLANELAEVVSKGLLSEHPDLLAGLCEMLRLGCMVGFDSNIVNDILQHKKLQIFKEDENFLSEFFRIEDSLELHHHHHQKGHHGSSSSRRKRKSFETSPRPAKSSDFGVATRMGLIVELELEKY